MNPGSRPASGGDTGRAPALRLGSLGPVAAGVVIPLGAGLLQWLLWDQFKPFVYFLFYPATFWSAWLGGVRSAMLSAGVSALLIFLVFLPPVASSRWPDGSHVVSLVVFIGMATVFGRVRDRLVRAERESREALEAAREGGERTIQSQEALLRRMSRLAQVGGWGFEVATGVGAWTDEVARIHDLEPSPEATANLGLSFYRGRHREAIERAVREAIELGTPYDLELELVTARGAVKWVRTQGQPVVENGQVVRLQGAFQDITRQKQVEEALRASQTKLEAALASMNDAVFISDAEGRFVEFNEAFATFHKFRGKGECARTFGEYPALLDVFLPDGSLAPVDQWAVPRALRGESATLAEYGLRRKDTGESWVGSYSFAPIRDESGAIVGAVVTARDITAQKASAEALKVSEARFRAVFEASPVGIVLTRFDDGRILDANPAFLDLLGFRLEALIGRTTVDVGLWARARDREEAMRSVRERSVLRDVEMDLEVAEGRRIPVTWSTRRVHLGETEVLVNLVQDQTQRREADAERQRLEAEVAHGQKLESLGAMASGVSHDMNNVLGAIMALGATVKETHQKDPVVSKAMDTLLYATERGRNLVKGLSDFARKDLLSAEPVDLNAVLRQEASLLSRMVGQGVSVDLKAEDPLPNVLGDAASISNAVMNLCVNARDAMPGGGVLTLGTRRDPGGPIELFVRDTGQGMAPEVLARAMEPFYTTKPPGKGTGLGLAQVYGVMKSHGGRVDIQSQPGVGTEVILRFPGRSSGG